MAVVGVHVRTAYARSPETDDDLPRSRLRIRIVLKLDFIRTCIDKSFHETLLPDILRITAIPSLLRRDGAPPSQTPNRLQNVSVR